MTIGFNICNVIFIYSPSVPQEWQSLLLMPNITVASIMACRTFRELKLGLFADPMVDGTFSNVVFRDMAAITQQPNEDSFELHTLDPDMNADGAGKRDACDIERPALEDVK
jgi:hypothetical protein